MLHNRPIKHPLLFEEVKRLETDSTQRELQLLQVIDHNSIRQQITTLLAEQTQPLPPTQIAEKIGRNKNSVRRELQAMLKAGVVKKDLNHAYSIANGNNQNTCKRFPRRSTITQAENTQKAIPSTSDAQTQPTPLTTDESAIPKLSTKLPKIKIDEVLFVAYTNPAPMTRSAPLDERETVIYRVLPEDLADKLAELQSEFDREISKHLRTVVRGRLNFIRYPLKLHKTSLEKLVEEWNKKYAEFAEHLFTQREELEKAITDFYGRHNVPRKAPELDHAYLLKRFRVNMFMIPFSLRSSVVSDVISNDEWRRITAQAKDTVMQTYREEMNNQLNDFFASMKALMQRLHEGKMVTANNLKRLHRLYNEALEGLAVTQDDEKYEPIFDVMGNLITTLSDKHDKHQSLKENRDLAAGIVVETLHATKAIGTQAKPILEEFETILAVEKQPAKKAREGIREILEGLTLPS